MITVDGHLDLSMNAMEWNRDLRLEIHELRSKEAGLTDFPDRGGGTVSFPEMRRGNIALCVATLIARYVKKSNPLPGWQSPEQAWAHTCGQLAWYHEMEHAGELRLVQDIKSLTSHLKSWDSEKTPIGYVLSLEGADSIISMEHLEVRYEQGLRALGPAHYGPGTYAHGTNSSGGIGDLGRELLEKMEELNIILDATHLCDQSFWEAIDVFNGPIWASHSNCRALVSDHRQFSDEQLKVLFNRGAMVGVAMDAWMLHDDWEKGKSNPKTLGVNLESVVDHIDHLCQLAGNANQVGIGSDLDGGFGKEQCPYDLETIADHQKIAKILKDRSYKENEIGNIIGRNWIDFLQNAWKE